VDQSAAELHVKPKTCMSTSVHLLPSAQVNRLSYDASDYDN
jgi:hypothetical protein